MERSEWVKPLQSATDPHEEAVLEEIRAALRGITFGSILVKIHEGEVVGIETSTKVRIKGSTSP
jgi:hypothetical protein